MKSSLDKICSLYRHPAWGPVPVASHWSAAEALVGRELPSDFKQLVEHCGGCPLGHGLQLLNPAVATNDFIALNRSGMMRIYAGWKDIASLRDFYLFPDLGGCITLARIDLTLLMLAPTGDEVFVADFGDFDPPVNSGLSISELIWSTWEDRAAFNDLGSHIWREDKEMFDLRFPFR